MIPTIEQVMKCYRVIAQIERAKTGRPGEETVKNVLRGTANVCQAAGVQLHFTVDALTRKEIDKALASFISRGVARLSAWSYVCQLRGLFARWCQPYYKDAGWDIRPLELPVFRALPPRYVRPSVETLLRVKRWYKRQTSEHWFASTMMLEFAMRNGDVLRLKDSNFVDTGTGHFLSYTPHKTELTSGRRVYWPIHDTIWRKFEDYGGFSGLDVTNETFDDINRDLRELGFHGSKAAYELRKICIDHIYQKFGAEMAVSISGDDIKTITKYYADPAQPNIGAVRVIDLL
ncbi:MAG: hypothetical protein J6R18_06610 [Kiritimatiellae bacterium]|nr:hypothetical protein [Kiritimatiellia bacterium]